MTRTSLKPASKPASAAEIADLLQILFNSLPSQRGIKPDIAALAYLESLRGFTFEAIKAGIQRFLRGQVEDVSPRFVPAPPELAKIIRSTAVSNRVPPTREIPSVPAQSPGERARMKLKMPMFQHASAQGRMDELSRANAQGFGAMAVLAIDWGIAVPEELLAIDAAVAEREWRDARNRAWKEIERNPPPFLRAKYRFHNIEVAA